jgi:hypothetical protein
MNYGIYLSSVGEFSNPTLLAELGHEAEEERWDGVVTILDPRENRAIRPEEVSALKAYINPYRENNNPFDIVVILWSEGGRTPKELQETVQYAEAGVTWWLEDLSTERFPSLEEVRERLHKGPPGI